MKNIIDLTIKNIVKILIISGFVFLLLPIVFFILIHILNFDFSTILYIGQKARKKPDIFTICYFSPSPALPPFTIFF